MPGLTIRNFDQADEVRAPDKTKVDIVALGDHKVARLTAQSGWKWSECIKPVAGTDTCQVHHVGVIISGTMHVVHADGTEGEAHPGEAYVIEPGHDAWVVGDEPVVAYEFDNSAAQTFAAPTN